MEPTLCDGDYILLNRAAFVVEEPQRGDVVVFLNESDGGKPLIKRVVAVGGDEIGILKDNLYLNGKVIKEPYVQETRGYNPQESRIWNVPEGYYFVLGDNRDVSRDSRDESVGFVKKDTIIGKLMIRIHPFSKFGTVE